MSDDLKKTNGLNWPTVILVIVTGGGNWFATQNKGEQISAEAQEAIRQIHAMHRSIDDFEQRQKDELDLLRRLANKP